LYLDHAFVVVGGNRSGKAVRVARAQGARLHVLAREVAFSLQRAKVIVDPVGGTDAHVSADLAQRGRITAVGNGASNVFEHLLLTIREALHGGREPTEHACPCQQSGSLAVDPATATTSTSTWTPYGAIFHSLAKTLFSKGSEWQVLHSLSFLS